MMHGTTDPVWEAQYSEGHSQRYPWDAVVSFIFRNAPRDRPRTQVSVLEVGYGTASNLWFAAREGFQVCGIEGSPSAVRAAEDRFREEELPGDLRCGEFPELPFADNSVDLGIDRCATTCVSRQVATDTIREVHRVLRPSGRFFLNTYSSEHSSAKSGTLASDGRRIDIVTGTLVGAGGICFYDEAQLREVIGDGWTILELCHLISDDRNTTDGIHAEWRVTLEKAIR